MARPPKFKTLEELKVKIEGYLAQCESKKEMPNKAGACLFLDITRETYGEWKKDKHILSYAIKTLDRTIENVWIQRLAGNAPTGAIFYLKNAFHEFYKDRQETDITSGGKPIYLPSEIIAKHKLSDITRRSKGNSK